MRLTEILNEAPPFTDKQEERFLSSLKKTVDTTDKWPQPGAMTKMVKSASPKAKKVGSGYYSQAYGRPRSNTVIKVTHGGGGSEVNALKFLRWAKKQKNPHLPKIYNITKKMLDTRRSYWDDNPDVHVYVRMEKLIPFKPHKYKWKPKHVPFLEWMDEHGYLYGEPYDFVPGWEELKRKARQLPLGKLVRTLQSLIKLTDNDELDISMDSRSAHNIMLRPSTGEIVIHDPIA